MLFTVSFSTKICLSSNYIISKTHIARKTRIQCLNIKRAIERFFAKLRNGLFKQWGDLHGCVEFIRPRPHLFSFIIAVHDTSQFPINLQRYSNVILPTVVRLN